MISELISQFKELSKNIETAIVTDDRQVVIALDRQISYVWNEIMISEPANTTETHLLIRFLLDHLLEKREIRESEKHAKDKILKIVSARLAG